MKKLIIIMAIALISCESRISENRHNVVFYDKTEMLWTYSTVTSELGNVVYIPSETLRSGYSFYIGTGEFIIISLKKLDTPDESIIIRNIEKDCSVSAFYVDGNTRLEYSY